MMNSTSGKAPMLGYLALAFVCVVWGTTYLALRIGVMQFPPFLFSMLRFLTAGPILIGLMLTIGKVKLPGKEVLIHQAISGFFMITVGISIVGWAEVYISSGMAAIICSIMPVWVILINLLVNKDDKPSFLILVGLAIGFSGIVMIFSEHLADFANSNYQLGILMTFLGNLGWAFGSVWIKKRNNHSNPFLNAGLQMLFGGLFLIPISLVLDDYSKIQWTNEVIYSLTYLSLIGSVAGYACYSYAIKHLPMTLVSLYAYVNPIVAILLGWLILSEKLTLKIILSMFLTVAGIYIVNKGYQLRTKWRTQLSK
ncbi:MAG: EamA family transporter [Cyclobacteriaceae bacterium]|jgi:drug/metabolite transporter (DMT)-like permease|nr:EamA family transporter [Cyclobacteriaceae bacterium]